MSFQVQKLAYEESKKTVDTKQHFGCIIMNKKKLVTRGHNFYCSGKTQTCCCHAEMDAISKHIKQLGLWKKFQTLLKFSYKNQRVLYRMEGKDR